MGRIPTVDDAANAVLYLACDATGVTAQTILVDCGVTALHPVRRRSHFAMKILPAGALGSDVPQGMSPVYKSIHIRPIESS